MQFNSDNSRYSYVDPGCAINWDHPLAKGLQIWILPGLPGTPFGGSRALNLVGRNHGTVTGATISAPIWDKQSPAGGCGSLRFDGTDDSITLTQNSTLPFNFTIQGWIRPTAVAFASGNIFSSYQNSSGDGVMINLNGDASAKLRVTRTKSYSSATALSDSALTINQWIHFRAQVSGTSLRLFVNGELQTTTGTTGTTALVTTPQFIARNESGGFFAGHIADISINSAAVPSNYGLSRVGYRSPDSPLRWVSSRCYSIGD